MGRRVWHAWRRDWTGKPVWGALFGVMVSLAATPALARPEAFNIRLTPAIALMISSDQLEALDYDRPGLLGSLHGAYRARPWLEARVALHGGAFFSKDNTTGGLLAFTGGALVRGSGAISPYLALDFGTAFTGVVVRPYFLVSAGVDLRSDEHVAIGPAFGYGRCVQWNRPDDRAPEGWVPSTDAGYLWIGLSGRVQLWGTPAPPKPRPPPPPPPPPEPPPPPPSSTDVIELIERTLPAPTRVELLAPVLFAFDSDALEPIGVAMLHEVASTLRARPDIKLLQIQGYADERGDAEYNRALSQRRAERVRAWLIEHGVEAERLTLDPHGATSFVEAGGDEAAHTQNRRVIFRVLEADPP